MVDQKSEIHKRTSKLLKFLFTLLILIVILQVGTLYFVWNQKSVFPISSVVDNALKHYYTQLPQLETTYNNCTTLILKYNNKDYDFISYKCYTEEMNKEFKKGVRTGMNHANDVIMKEFVERAQNCTPITLQYGEKEVSLIDKKCIE